MFGELCGLWLADLWDRAGRPPAHYVELGPGRGTLAADALRAMRGIGLAPAVHLVETSPALHRAQADRLPGAIWHDRVNTLPDDAPLLVVANEFFDALPFEQRVETGTGWIERRVAFDGDRFFALPDGRIAERCPAGEAIVAALAARIARQGGALLAIDYGYAGPAIGDTLQAVKAHGYADPFAEPGEADLTAHVDFTALAAAAGGGVAIRGPAEQGGWLERLGIAARAAALARAAPARADEIAAARLRLTAPEAMGRLFKILALTAPGWPEPAGF